MVDNSPVIQNENLAEKPYDKGDFGECVKQCFHNTEHLIDLPFALLKAKILSEVVISGNLPTQDEISARMKAVSFTKIN